MMKRKSKVETVTLTQDDANRILSNIFFQLQTEPNTVPLSVLESYSNYRVERFALQRTILAILMGLFMLLPAMFIAPKVDITPMEDEARATYLMTVDSLIPISRITAKVGNRNVAISEINSHIFTLQPQNNGEMEVNIKLMNQQYVVENVTVGNVDNETPNLVSNDYDGEILNLFFTDNESGIDYAGIYSTLPDGTRVSPNSYDEESGMVTFPYPTQTVNIFVPDFAGNTLHLVISLK